LLLLDVQLAGKMNGVEAAVAIRREFPRQTIVFYSIQDEEAYYRAFRSSGIPSHYAYVRKSNYLLPEMIVPLLKDAVEGRSFIDPEIESRVQEVRHKDAHAPLAMLEPNEQEVARMLAQGMTNEQIAARMGFRDKRTISRTNGQPAPALHRTAGTGPAVPPRPPRRDSAGLACGDAQSQRPTENGLPGRRAETGGGHDRDTVSTRGPDRERGERRRRRSPVSQMLERRR
jgi:hypothetical protein